MPHTEKREMSDIPQCQQITVASKNFPIQKNTDKLFHYECVNELFVIYGDKQYSEDMC